MNKKDVIANLAQDLATTKTEAAVILESMIGTMVGVLQDGETLSLPGFGKFEVTRTKDRIGRNPKTGEEIEIFAKNKVKFRASKKLKESIQE